ncbi:MbnP family protein [Chryseobacterium sp. T1]
MTIKKYLYLLTVVFTLVLLSSCRNNDDDSTEITTGNLQVKFENGFNNLGPIVLGKTTQTSVNGQKHNFTDLKYIVSNISLIDDQGKEFQYHYNNPDLGAFIVDQDEAVANVIYVNLKDIPKNNYKKIKFGLGISQNAYLLGQSGQGVFWDKAKAKGMNWSWAAGYIFAKLEGFYGTVSADKPYKNHTGNMGNVAQNNTPDLYREVTLDLPTTARVTSNITPSIHILADLNQFLSGTTPLILDIKNDNAMGSNGHLVNVSNNLSKMFKVDHVHND